MDTKQRIKYASMLGILLSAVSFLATSYLQAGTAFAIQQEEYGSGGSSSLGSNSSSNNNNTGTAAGQTMTSNDNGTGKQFFEQLLHPNTQGMVNATSAGNYTLGKQGFGGNTTVSEQGVPFPIDTSTFRMHVNEAQSAAQSGDTQGAVNHIILALQELDSILTGNATGTAGAMTSNNATSMSNATSPSTMMGPSSMMNNQTSSSSMASQEFGNQSAMQ